MDKGKFPIQEEENLQSILCSTSYSVPPPLSSPEFSAIPSEPSSFGNEVAFNCSSFSNQNLLADNNTVAGSSPLDSHCPTNHQTLSFNGVDDRPLLDSHMYNLIKSQPSSCGNLLLKNTNIFSGSFPSPQPLNQQNRNHRYQNLLSNTIYGGNCLPDSNSHSFSHNQNYNITDGNCLLYSFFQTLPPNDSAIGDSSLLDSNLHTPNQNQLIDNENLLPSNASSDNGFADWDSADGTTYLSAFDENDDLLSTFGDINHINSQESDFSMAPTLDTVVLSSEQSSSVTPSVPPPVPMVQKAFMPLVIPAAPTLTMPPLESTNLASSIRFKENKLTADLELSQLGSKRARRIMINRKAAMKAKDKRKQYLSELEYKIESLRSRSNTFSAQLALLQTKKDSLYSEQNKLKQRLSTILEEVQLQEKLNEALRQEIHNLKLLTGVLDLPPDDIEVINNGMSSQTNTHPIDALQQLQHQSQSLQEQTRLIDPRIPMTELPQLQVQSSNHLQPQLDLVPQVTTRAVQQLPQLRDPISSQQQHSHREVPAPRETISSEHQQPQIQFQVSNQHQQLHHHSLRQAEALRTTQLLVHGLHQQQPYYLAPSDRQRHQENIF